MTKRAALAAFTLAGLPAAAAAQEFITYSWTWSEVLANTSTPVSSPNGLIEPGEGVRLALTIQVTPGIGSPVTYQSPPGPGSGTLAAIGSIFFDLLGTNVNGGQWSVFRRQSSWNLGNPGTGQPGGSLTSASAGQFILTSIPDSRNPVVNVWIATWTPGVYDPRVASFQSQGAVAGGGNHSAILIQYGEDPNTGDPLYVGRFIGGIFGNSGPIPVVPAPAATVVLALAALAASKRRR